MNPALASHLWQSTWFAVAVGLLTLFFRRNRARVRFALWLCASLKFLVPFSPLIDFARQLAPPSPAPAMMERLAITLAEPAGSLAATAPPLTQPPTDWLAIALVFLWAGGLAAIALVRLRGWRRVRAALHASRAMDIEAAIPVRVSSGLLEPGVVGVLRPVLLIPDGIAGRLTPPQLASVLAHELCHVRRRDNLAAGIHMVVEALFWFHPLVWWVGARMVEERERACDEAVLSLGSAPADYAEAILGVCKLYVESPLACVSGVTGANLKKRIEAIMSHRVGERLGLAKKLLLAAAGAAALVVPALLGVLVGAGHLPLLHAQQIPPPSAPPVQVAQTPQGGRGSATPPAAPQPARGKPEIFYTGDRHLIAQLFTPGAMTPDELGRARAAASHFVETQLPEGDLLSILVAAQGKVTVLQDFTRDKVQLQSAIVRATTAGGPDPSSRAAVLEQAVRILGAIPGKKALFYFVSGSSGQLNDDAAIARATQAAVAANVAFYPVDMRAVPVVNFIPKAQNPPAQPVFEVASVKRAEQCFSGPRSIDPGSVTLSGLPLKAILMEAFKVTMDQIEAPSWLETACFDISAKFPQGVTKEQLPEMLQALLAERFKLVAHKVDRASSGYILVVDKGGPKLKEDDPKANFMRAPDGRQLTFFGASGHGGLKGVMTMATLASIFTRQGLGPVQDATGLTGKYDIDLKWTPDAAPTPSGADSPDPDLVTALRTQLGLRLERRSAQVPFLVVDRIERNPTEN